MFEYKITGEIPEVRPDKRKPASVSISISITQRQGRTDGRTDGRTIYGLIQNIETTQKFPAFQKNG